MPWRRPSRHNAPPGGLVRRREPEWVGERTNERTSERSHGGIAARKTNAAPPNKHNRAHRRGIPLSSASLRCERRPSASPSPPASVAGPRGEGSDRAGTDGIAWEGWVLGGPVPCPRHSLSCTRDLAGNANCSGEETRLPSPRVDDTKPIVEIGGHELFQKTKQEGRVFPVRLGRRQNAIALPGPPNPLVRSWLPARGASETISSRKQEQERRDETRLALRRFAGEAGNKRVSFGKEMDSSTPTASQFFNHL
mmetsp:Transcript_26746/g.57353  ORF Transcript_26746/g.57353 Transcript_26746/m.57353 type:complete len:252 (-) Transcript_26746:195-950(-)